MSKLDTRAALGSDPFAEGDSTLPYLLRLREHSVRLVREAVTPQPGAPAGEARHARQSLDLGPEVPEVASFEERDESAGWLDRAAGWLLEREDEERLAQITARLGARRYESLGLDPKTTRRTLAVFKQLYRHYFRVVSEGHQVIPEKEGAVLAANHGGMLPFDAAMVIVDLALRANPPRLARAVVDRWAGTLPFINVFYARVGQVIGSRDNFRELLRTRQLVLTFPEGLPAIHKRAAERYVLRDFHLGFVEESLRHRVPIIPIAVVGPDDQAPILWNAKPLAKLLHLPFFPITPTFPWLGPLGLLPYPVKYHITYGEPFRFHEEFPASAIDDPQAVRYMAEQVRRRIQEMVDRRVLERRGGES